MLWADGNKMAATRGLVEEATLLGLWKITSIFGRTSFAHDQTELAAYERAAVGSFESEEYTPVNNTLAIQETLRCKKNKHQDKESSKRNGRFFLRDWFERYDQKRKAFCSMCTNYSDTQREVFKRARTCRLASLTRGLQGPFAPAFPFAIAKQQSCFVIVINNHSHAGVSLLSILDNFGGLSPPSKNLSLFYLLSRDQAVIITWANSVMTIYSQHVVYYSSLRKFFNSTYQ